MEATLHIGGLVAAGFDTSGRFFRLFLRYMEWLGIYFPLFLLVSFPAAFLLDRFFPTSFEIGRPMSFQRFWVMGVWFTVVTILVWPAWHWFGDLFLPDRDRLKRFKHLFVAHARLEEVQIEEFKKIRKGQSR